MTYCLGARGHERVSAADPALLTTPDGEPGIRSSSAAPAATCSASTGASARPSTGTTPSRASTPRRITEIGSGRPCVTADGRASYRIGASGVGRFRLRLDDEPAVRRAARAAAGRRPGRGPDAPAAGGGPRSTLAAGQAVARRRCATTSVDGPHRREDRRLALPARRRLARSDDDASLAHAVADAAAADLAVVVVGTTEEVESEGFDRTSLALPGRQDELVRRVAAANPRTVVVVNAGAPVLMPWRDEVAAILLAWFPGQEFGGALADVLLGRAEPGGRLPTTWPAARDAPAVHHAGRRRRSTTPRACTSATARFLRDGVEPAYWFGHGLGYTTWSYDELASPPTAEVGGDGEQHRRPARAGGRAGLPVPGRQRDRPRARSGLWASGRPRSSRARRRPCASR